MSSSSFLIVNGSVLVKLSKEWGREICLVVVGFFISVCGSI